MTNQSFDQALMRLWPNGDRKVVGLRAGIIAAAPAVFKKYGITSPLLVAHVMAQISHECGAGNDVVENLSYTAQRMTEIWPSRFKSIAAAQPYARNPRGLANKVYNGRMGNRPGSDDGWDFRGRGAVQTTGREGYERLQKATGLPVVTNPDLVNDPRHFLECGVADFINCGCLPFARRDDITGATRKLNGGTIGLADRKAWLKKWKQALGVGTSAGQKAATAVVVAAPATASVAAQAAGVSLPTIAIAMAAVIAAGLIGYLIWRSRQNRRS